MSDELAPGDVSTGRQFHVAPVFSQPRRGRYIILIYILSILFPIFVGLFAGIVIALSGHSTTDVTSRVNSAGFLASSLVATWVALVGGVALLSRRYGTGSLVRDYGLSFRLIDIPFGIALGVFGTVVANLAELPIVVFWRHASSKIHSQTKSLLPGHGAVLAGIVVLIVVITPFIEELFFRGLVTNYVASRTRRRNLAIFVAGLLFGLAHAFDEPVAMPALAVLGMILAYVYWRTGRLGPTIVAHATFNAVTVLALLHH